MPNKKIRALQRANSKKLDENGMALVRQRRFPTPTQPQSKIYRRDREMERRRQQIARGYLTASNGLAVSSPQDQTNG
jgi:hypothetical protein